MFAEPSKKLDHWDVISGLRDHYQGTPAEPYFNRNPSGPWRPISLLRTQVTHVSVQRPAGGGLPQELRTVGERRARRGRRFPSSPLLGRWAPAAALGCLDD